MPNVVVYLVMATEVSWNGCTYKRTVPPLHSCTTVTDTHFIKWVTYTPLFWYQEDVQGSTPNQV